MKVWVQHYNHHRPHSAADGQAPASLFPGRVTNVLPSYSYTALMAKSQDVEATSSSFSDLLEAAVKLPYVKINRAEYLQGALRRHCTDEQIVRAIETSPAAAGVPRETIIAAARISIRYETAKVTGLSAAAGVPGWAALPATVPADAAQYLGHMLRIAQKLAYIYSWPDLFSEDDDLVDEATEGVLILFVGVMLGVQAAHGGISRLSGVIAGQVAKKLPQKALTQGALYPVVKRVAALLGVRMTKQLFAQGVSKAVPVLGAAVNGGVSLVSFRYMCRRLDKHLASLELTKPDLRAAAPDDDHSSDDEA